MFFGEVRSLPEPTPRSLRPGISVYLSPSVPLLRCFSTVMGLTRQNPCFIVHSPWDTLNRGRKTLRKVGARRMPRPFVLLTLEVLRGSFEVIGFVKCFEHLPFRTDVSE